MYQAFKQHPKKKYDEEDGDWYWSCTCNKRRYGECDNRIVLDKLIPETPIDDLAFVENPILYTPEPKENN